MADFLNAPLDQTPVAIYRDAGGVVNDYITAANRYNREHREVRIIGDCYSACMMALSVRSVCLYPKAKVYFHFIRSAVTGLADPVMTEKLILNFPYPIYERLLGNLQADFTPAATLSGAQLIELGYKACPDAVFAPGGAR